MEELGPIALGTLSPSLKKYTMSGPDSSGASVGARGRARARELVRDVYLLTAEFTVGERFGLVSQMDRFAVSIPSNIAEGYGRATTQDYLHFLRSARGRAYELETQLALSEDLGLCAQTASSRVAATLQEEIRLLQGLIAALERRTER